MIATQFECWLNRQMVDWSDRSYRLTIQGFYQNSCLFFFSVSSFLTIRLNNRIGISIFIRNTGFVKSKHFIKDTNRTFNDAHR